MKSRDVISFTITIIAVVVLVFGIGYSMGYGKGSDFAVDRCEVAMRELDDEWALAYNELADRHLSYIRGDDG